jgi:hypothetical protein
MSVVGIIVNLRGVENINVWENVALMQRIEPNFAETKTGTQLIFFRPEANFSLGKTEA